MENMNWKEPTPEAPYLFLPKIGNIHHTLQQTQCQENIKVNETFLKSWHNGPESQSSKDIHDALYTLIQSFAQLAKKVKTTVKAVTKGHPTDYVTETDQGIEMLFRIWIQRHLPTHKIIGEEGPKASIETQDVVWYIDPIDGTSNYVETPLDEIPNVSMHFGSTYQGAPFISIVAYPFHNTCYSCYVGNPSPSPLPPTLPPPLQTQKSIGSEFSGIHQEKKYYLEKLCHNIQAKPVTYKSIGINLTALLENHSTAFFKDATKLWDVIAPLCLINTYRPDLCIECLFPKKNTTLTPETYISISPFSNNPDWITHLNTRHSLDNKESPSYCRAGTILVFPKDQPEIRDHLLTCIWEIKQNPKYAI